MTRPLHDMSEAPSFEPMRRPYGSMPRAGRNLHKSNSGWASLRERAGGRKYANRTAAKRGS